MNRRLYLHLLGSPDVRLDSQQLAFSTRKTLALLIYLAVEGGEQPREHLAALLWPESSPERAYASLRNTLNHLQTGLRDGNPAALSYLSVTHQALALNPDASIDLDTQTVARGYALARSDRASRAPAESPAGLPVLRAAAACYRGDFLAGFSLGDAPAFDDWAAAQREVWRRRLGLVLDRLSEIQFAGGEFAGTAETAAAWIALDALNEVAYRRKMRAHFAAGERGQALETYDMCRTVLEAEIHVQPEPDTEVLAARIRAQQALTRAVPEPQRSDTPVAFLENLFIGRSAEYQALAERYGRAAEGRPQVVLLRGEAGIGKTRLARAFLAWAVAQGAETLAGRAFESGSRMPYQPLMEAVGPVVEREHRLHNLLGEAWLAPLSHLLPELRVRHPESPAAPLETQAGRTPLFEALVRLTLALAERAPVVLFLDDLQWTDSATLDFLQYAIRRWRERSAPIVLLAGVRSEALRPLTPHGSASLPRWLERMEREVEPYHLELELLPERDTVGTVASLLVPPALDFAQWVCQETHGHPFYLIETLKDLLERGALHPRRRADGQWGFEVDAEHDLGQAVRVPSTVRVVIRARLNRLSPAAFALLAAGAVLERRLTFEHLCAVSRVAEDRALAAIDELVSGRLLSEEAQPGAAGTYAFANDMLRDVVYTEAGDARRRLFHRRALAALAAAGESAAVLAHHALAAGLAEPAFRHSLAAGQEALHVSAAGDAVEHFENARQLAREAPASERSARIEPHLRDLYEQLARAYELAGQHGQALAVQHEWERLARAR